MPNRQERKKRTVVKKEAAKNEEILNNILAEQSKMSKLEKAQAALGNLNERKFKMMFVTPETPMQQDGKHVASGAVIEIYTHVQALRKNGFDAFILAQRRDYLAPSYLDQDLQALPHLYAEGSLFPVSPEDWLIIPDYYTNLMEYTKKLSCTRIVFAQNYDFIITSNLGGMTWKDLGMSNAIATSPQMKEFIEKWHGANLYDIQTYRLGVPEYFAKKVLKKPIISFFSRNSDDIKRISKLFYYRFPELQWVVFEDLRGKSRTEFAQKLAESEVLLFLDRIASFGQPAIEAMKADTVVVGLAPDVIPEYMTENAGIWTADYYQIPELLGQVFKMLISDEFPEEIRTAMKAKADYYSPENSEASIMAVYEHFLTERKAILEEAVEVEEKMEAQLKLEQKAAQE